MPIASSDLKLKLSIKTGSAGNSLPQTDPNASLGKYISTTEYTGGVLLDLFDAVTGDENSASDVEYRCVFIQNLHATLNLQNPVVWINSQVAGGASMAIAVDTVAQSIIGASAAQAGASANENSAPTPVSGSIVFSSPASKGAGLSLGATLDAGKCRAIWIQRSAANSSALSNDGGVLSCEGDTEA